MHRFEESINQSELIDEIKTLSKKSDGIVVQLPLPRRFNAENVLKNIPPEKDVDVLSLDAKTIFKNGIFDIYPPVVGAIKEIFDRYEVLWDLVIYPI